MAGYRGLRRDRSKRASAGGAHGYRELCWACQGWEYCYKAGGGRRWVVATMGGLGSSMKPVRFH